MDSTEGVCATVRSRVRSMAHLLVLSMVLIATFRARLLIRVGGGELYLRQGLGPLHRSTVGSSPVGLFGSAGASLWACFSGRPAQDVSEARAAMRGRQETDRYRVFKRDDSIAMMC